MSPKSNTADSTKSPTADFSNEVKKKPVRRISIQTPKINYNFLKRKSRKESTAEKQTLIDLFEHSVEKYSDKPFLWERDSRYRAITYKQGKNLVYKLGGGFLSLGLKKGDRVALLAEGCNAWILGEMGILFAGGINVPLSVKLSESSDLLFRLNHSETRFVMVSISQLKKIRSIIDQLTTVEKVIIIGNMQTKLNSGELLLDDLYALGEAWNGNHPGELQTIASSIRENDLANITYTSGTTADPKGVMAITGLGNERICFCTSSIFNLGVPSLPM